MWVQVPQWEADWSRCAVDVPDADCHWYVVAPDNTFGEGFDWAIAPWFDANGLSDIAQLTNTMTKINRQAANLPSPDLFPPAQGPNPLPSAMSVPTADSAWSGVHLAEAASA